MIGPHCDFVDAWLDDWVAGRLPEPAAAWIRGHVRVCERCRRLAAVVSEASSEAEWSLAGDDDQEGLLAGVLARTSGGTCERAEAMLPALGDGELDAAGAEMLREHVAHCTPCSRLLSALQEARELLPTLAEIEPPFGFTTRVLAATSRAPERPALVAWWRRVLARPRASVELAYLGALLLVVVLGNPVAAFHDAGAHARRFVDGVPIERLAERLPAHMTARSAAESVVAAARGRFGDEVSRIAAEVSRRWQQATALLAQVRRSLEDAANWVLTFDWRHPFTGRTPAAPPANKAPPEGPSAGGDRTPGGTATFTV